MSKLGSLVRERILILDGAMGTMIQQYNLTEEDFRGERFSQIPGQMKGNNDLLCLTRPDVIQDIHRKYLAAGADIIETNTFSSTRVSMADYHVQDYVREMNLAAVRLARKVADEFTSLTPDKPRFVAGSVGPTNKTCSMSPDVNNPAFRALSYDELADAYREQMEALLEGGVDALLIETIFDTLNAKAAIFAAGQAMETLFASVMSNPKFLYSSFYTFTNDQVIDFFEELGVRTKIERGNRVFPLSDHSSDVIAGLKRKLETLGVHICLETEVEKIEERDGKFQAIVLKGGQRKTGDACIVATGGISYPATGSTGDGYRFAKENGHQITKLYPALVPMEVREWYAKELQGLSLRNVSAAVYDGKKKLYEDFGEMLFTHYGVSGPLMLSASSVIGKRLSEKELCLVIDLKPALTAEQLDARVLREFEEHKNKQFKNACGVSSSR